MANIYIQTAGQEPYDNIKDLLVRCYSVERSGDFVPTYSDIECSTIQCHHAWRSFEDLLNICQTYFSKTTPKELAKIIFELNNDYPYIDATYCNYIDKVVFFANKYSLRPGFFADKLYKDDILNERGNGKYTFNEILELINSK